MGGAFMALLFFWSLCGGSSLMANWEQRLRFGDDIGVVHWNSIDDALHKRGLLENSRPVRLSGKFFEDLAAFHWSLDEIISASVPVINAREQTSPLFGYVTEDGTKLPLPDDGWVKLFQSQRKKMPLTHLLSSNNLVHRYLSIHFDDFSPQLARHFPAHLLYPHDPGVNASESIPPSSYFWLGQGAGTKAALHYDGNHNIYLQLKGVKEFLIFPPAELSKLYLFPYLSSLARQSALDWAHALPDLRHVEEDFPRFVNCSCHLITLKEGDALYLPPFWAHKVELKSDWGVSLNVWTDCKSQFIHDVELFKLPLPFESAWSWQEKVIVWATMFGPRIYNGSSDWPTFFRRYIATPYAFKSTRAGRCDSAVAIQIDSNLSLDFVNASKVELYSLRIRDLASSSLDPYDILCASYLELTLFNVFGSLDCVPHAVTSIGQVVDEHARRFS